MIKTDIKSNSRLSANNVGLLLFCVALFTPFMLGYNISRAELSLLGAYWIWGYGSPGLRLLSVIELLVYNLFIIPRHLFAYQMVKLYQMRTSRRRAILAGVLSDSPSLVMSIMASRSFMLVLPTPFPLLIGYILLKLVEPPRIPISMLEHESWLDMSE